MYKILHVPMQSHIDIYGDEGAQIQSHVPSLLARLNVPKLSQGLALGKVHL